MNVKAKKMLSLVLAFVMVLGMLPATVFATNEAGRFADVPAGTWFSNPVQYVSDNGLMVGVDDNHFAPGGLTTRCMVVKVLHSMEGEPSAEGTGFTDVEDGVWYTEAILWAQANGIVEGYGDGTFRPHASMTREEMMAVIYSYSQYKGYDVSETTSLRVFTDSIKIQSYAEEAMAWAVSVGLIVGFEDGTIRPQADSTRAQLATVLMRFCQMFESWNVCTVTFETNGGSAVEAQVLECGGYAKEPDDPIREGYFFLGWFVAPNPESINDVFDFNTTSIVGDTTLYAEWISLDDADGEGLVDGLEKYYGTDINKPDSDDDGLSDYIEVVILGTDPLSNDSDNDGIEDMDQDDDGDGITNGDELGQGTNPGSNDTDSDLLTDNEEFELGTDPLNYDTDGDGASDYTEVELGTDPLTADASFDVVVDSDVEDTVRPSVVITLEGDQVDTLAVDPLIEDNFFPEDMPGYLGMPYNFSVDGEFASATIRFEFDSAILENGADPAIFYFNEVDQTLEELETTIEGNVASAVVNHFSVYLLIDRNVYYDSFEWEDVWDTEGTYDGVEIIMVIDDSGSLGGDYGCDSSTGFFTGGNDPQHLRLSAARDFVDKSSTAAKIGIVKFDGIVDIFSNLLVCDDEGKNTLKSLLQITPDIYDNTDYNSPGVFDSRGYTYMYSGINTALGMFTSTEDSILRAVIVFTDGDAHDASMHSQIVNDANSMGVRVYTVGLGSSTSYFTNYLRPLAENTGGAFYMTPNADQLADIYNDISKKIDLEADADSDGIPDYYEDYMIAFNGKKIALDKNAKDSDGDGLEDGEEVTVELVYNADRTKVYVKGKLNSYPDNIDSDNDSILDYHDPDPMSYTITDRVISWVEGLSYSNLVNHVGKTLGKAIEDGAVLDGISSKYASYLKDAVIVAANDSGGKHWDDFFEDRGLGMVALKIMRRNEKPAVIFALRGTEPDDDLVNDGLTDLVLGLGWSSAQSDVAFYAYNMVATNTTYDYYVTGHSLGGRLAQDVIYKIYNANEGGWFKEKANIIVPTYSATFNALGYNKAVYVTLENDILASYDNKLSNFYYWSDLVGEGLGCRGVFQRAGTDVFLWGREIDGDLLRTEDELENWISVRDSKYHGINYFHSDYDMLYASTDKPADFKPGGTDYGYKVSHDYKYWID